MALPGRRPTGKPTVDRNPRVHDWTEVPDVPFKGEKLPARRPDGRAWPKETRRWWAAVSTMPHCVTWRDSDWSFALDTALIAARFHEGDDKAAAELRIREKTLGTTHESRMGLRFRYVDPAPAGPAAEVTHLADYRDL